MRLRRVIFPSAMALFGVLAAQACAQTPSTHSLDEKAQREYTGTYQWYGDGFVDLQLWGELTATNQLVAIDARGFTPEIVRPQKKTG